MWGFQNQTMRAICFSILGYITHMHHPTVPHTHIPYNRTIFYRPWYLHTFACAHDGTHCRSRCYYRCPAIHCAYNNDSRSCCMICCCAWNIYTRIHVCIHICLPACLRACLPACVHTHALHWNERSHWSPDCYGSCGTHPTNSPDAGPRVYLSLYKWTTDRYN